MTKKPVAEKQASGKTAARKTAQKPPEWLRYFADLDSDAPSNLFYIERALHNAIQTFAVREGLPVGSMTGFLRVGLLDVPDAVIDGVEKKVPSTTDELLEMEKEIRSKSPMLGFQELPSCYNTFAITDSSDSSHTIFGISKDGFYSVHVKHSGSMKDMETTVRCISLRPEFAAQVEKFCSNLKDKPTHREQDFLGPLYMLSKNPMGWQASHFGNHGTKLEEGNYSAEARDGIRRIREDLETDYPLGRISILHGPSGTGKSHIIKDLLLIPSCMFIYVPARFVTMLNDNSLLSMLVQQRAMKGRVVLIIEDADEVLASRHADNVDQISTMLNIGDGVFSDALDVRFLLTSNQKLNEMDEAIRRRGRISSIVYVGKLKAYQANDALARIVGKEIEEPNLFMSDTSLADVYGKARELGWKPPKSNFHGLAGSGIGGVGPYGLSGMPGMIPQAHYVSSAQGPSLELPVNEFDMRLRPGHPVPEVQRYHAKDGDKGGDEARVEAARGVPAELLDLAGDALGLPDKLAALLHAPALGPRGRSVLPLRERADRLGRQVALARLEGRLTRPGAPPLSGPLHQAVAALLLADVPAAPALVLQHGELGLPGRPLPRPPALRSPHELGPYALPQGRVPPPGRLAPVGHVGAALAPVLDPVAELPAALLVGPGLPVGQLLPVDGQARGRSVRPSVWHQPQVREAVVGADAVDVVDDLLAGQRPAQMAGHHRTMDKLVRRLVAVVALLVEVGLPAHATQLFHWSPVDSMKRRMTDRSVSSNRLATSLS